MEFYHVALRGYAGWLLTNPQFLDERDGLLQKWSGQQAKHGIPQNGPTRFGGVPHAKMFQPVTDDSTSRFLSAFKQFYARWRLQHLKTRELPEPLSPQIPLVTPLAILTHMEAGGVSLYQPDTMPVPPRDRLRDILEEIRVHHQDDHLADWVDVVGRNRHNDNSLQFYGSILAVHHYWTVLEERHSQALKGNIGRVEEAFAEFLGTGRDAVHGHRQHVRDRLNGK